MIQIARPIVEGRAGAFWQPRRPWLLVAGVLVGLAASLVLLLILPGRTYTTQNTWDLMILYDGAQRVVMGQVPNRDFHTPLGLLVYLLLAGGAWLSGTAGGMMPVMTGLFVLMLMPLLLYACASRLPWLLALGFGVHIVILAIAPHLTGDVGVRPTFGMFYNRFGWALLSLLILFALPRRSPFGRPALDAAAMAVIWSMTFYLKASYAAIGGAYLLGLLAFPHMRKAAVGAMVASALLLLSVELFWGETFAYIGDLRAAGAASGAVQGGLHGLGKTVADNLQGLFLFACVLVLALVRGVRLNFLLIAGFAAAAGILVANQNYGGPGILTLFPAALVLLLDPAPGGRRDGDPLALGGFLLAAAMIVPPDIAALYNYAGHVGIVSRGPSGDPGEVRFDGLIARDAPPALGPQSAASLASRHGCGPIDATRLNLANRSGQITLSQGQYLGMIADGMTVLKGNPALSGNIFTYDMANPFNAVLHRHPLTGGNQWYHANRTFSLTSHLPAREAFGGADVAMVPKIPVEYATFDQLRSLYAPYLLANFDLAARSDCWDVYLRKRRRPL